jgi:hypothetical protein
MMPEYSRGMLHEFLIANRNELIKRCREKVVERFDSAMIPAGLDNGVPLFLQQLVDTLRSEQLTLKRNVADPAPTPSATEIGRTATAHGAEMLRMGFTVDQVVREYGDVCQSVTDMAVEEGTPISADEFRTLNRCLDDAIADAVTSFALTRQVAINDRAQDLRTRLDAFAAECMRLVDVANHAYSAIKTGKVGVFGATGSLLVHTLTELRYLAVRELPEIGLGNASPTAIDG